MSRRVVLPGSGGVPEDDPRLSDARTPTSHKTTHATGGSDALTPADIGAASNAAAVTVVTHGSGTGFARPLLPSVVYWIGTSAPLAGMQNDLWYNTATGELSVLGPAGWAATVDHAGDYLPVPSAANDGDVLTFDDASGEWVAAAPTGGGGSSREVRADYVSPYSYIGTASAGSDEDASVWAITRIEVTDPVVVDVATGVAWDDRLTIGFGV
jgi:hypothetical protein